MRSSWTRSAPRRNGDDRRRDRAPGALRHALRSRGVPIGVGDEVDAIRALTLVDVADSDEVRRALLVALKIRARDRAIFADVFDRDWSVADVADRRRAEPAASAPAGPALGALRRADSAVGFHEDEAGTAGNEAAAYSPDVALRRKPFEECSAGDLAEMERLLDRWMPRWAARPSRRLTPARSGGIPDIRRTFRRTVATDGEMLPLARRKRAIDEPRLVVLCDTSGSMDAHVRFVLAFVLALKRVSRRTEVFAFNTSLTRLTPWLSPGRILSTLERLAAGVSGLVGRHAHRRESRGVRGEVPERARRSEDGDRDRQRRTGPRGHDPRRRGHARAQRESPSYRLAESALRRSPLRADSTRHAGGSALHRSVRPGTQPGIARAHPARAGGLISMAMEISKTFVLKAPADAAWKFFIDPARVARCLPGATITNQVDDKTYAGTITMKVGPVAATYKGTMKFDQLDPATRTAAIVAAGQDVRGKGGADLRMTSRLVERSPGETEVQITSQVNVMGILAQFGRGMIQDVSDQMFDKFVAAARKELETSAAPPSVEGDGVAAVTAPAADTKHPVKPVARHPLKCSRSGRPSLPVPPAAPRGIRWSGSARASGSSLSGGGGADRASPTTAARHAAPLAEDRQEKRRKRRYILDRQAPSRTTATIRWPSFTTGRCC